MPFKLSYSYPTSKVVSSFYVDDTTPADLYPYDTMYETILRGGFCGRVIPFRQERTISTNGITIKPWVSFFKDDEEAAFALGRVILENILHVQSDGNNVRISGMLAYSDGRKISYSQIGKVETLLRQMPLRFTYKDLARAQKNNPETKRMHNATLIGVLYAHVLAGSLEYVADSLRKPTDSHNPTFIKRDEVYLSVPRL